MSTKIMVKLVIPFALSITLAIGFSLFMSTSTQALSNPVNVVSGENFMALRWGNNQISEGIKILDGRVDKTIDNNIDEHSHLDDFPSDFGIDEESPLVAVKTVSVEAAHPGEVIAYTITVTNTSEVDVENVSLTDYLADGLTELTLLVSSYGDPPSFSQRTVRWSGTILADTPLVISYLVEIAKGAEGEIPNDATIVDPYGELITDPVIVMVLPNITYTFLPVVAH